MSPHHYVIRRSENLLQQAQAVFGADLVTDAYVMTFEVPGITTDEEVQRLLRGLENQQWGDGSDLEYDAENIGIVFSNGVTVEFVASEWAGMRHPDGPRRWA